MCVMMIYFAHFMFRWKPVNVRIDGTYFASAFIKYFPLLVTCT